MILAHDADSGKNVTGKEVDEFDLSFLLLLSSFNFNPNMDNQINLHETHWHSGFGQRKNAMAGIHPQLIPL